MKYVKLFEQHADYEAYKNGGDYITPNVSYCVDNNEVHYEKFYDPYNGHEYIDLGLPSGTLWAKCNVGAETETDYGLYFQWGDTQGYESSEVGSGEGQKAFAWADYKYGTYDSLDTTNYGMTKYNGTDDKTSLDITDDAAHVNMGGEWTMPTDTQISELITLSHSVVTKNSVVGMEFTGTNGNTLFVPFSGIARGGSVISTGGGGGVWSSSLASNVRSAFGLGVNDEPDALLGDGDRCFGFSVRGVVSRN